jgi:hypothetical protein
MNDAQIIEHLTEIIHTETDIIVEMYKVLAQYMTIEEIEKSGFGQKLGEIRGE